MQRSFLARLQRTTLFSLVGALLLLPVIPLLQLLVLGPQGYGTALAAPQTSLIWIQGHIALFLLYRLILALGFALLLGLPFTLFRIIIAQEIVGRAELEAEEGTDEDKDSGEESTDENEAEKEDEANQPSAEETAGLPAFAWRGKGFAVIAAWTSLLSLIFLAAGTLGSTIYLWSSASIASVQAPLPGNFIDVSNLFAILTYAVGGSLLAISCIFFGIVIARSGRRLWPDSWVAFGYAALAIGAIASGSAVQVALAPTGGQASLTTPTLLLFAAWSLWFSFMVIRLKPE